MQGTQQSLSNKSAALPTHLRREVIHLVVGSPQQAPQQFGWGCHSQLAQGPHAVGQCLRVQEEQRYRVSVAENSLRLRKGIGTPICFGLNRHLT